MKNNHMTELLDDIKDVVDVLENVGFNEINNGEDVGYLIKYNYIEVYLKEEYLNIHLTPAYINLDIHKQEKSILYFHVTVNHCRSWYCVKSIKYKRKKELNQFRNFLLLSVCRDSFLDGDEVEMKKKGVERVANPYE